MKDYRTFKRIVLGPGHVDSGFTKHYKYGQLQSTPQALEIVQYPGDGQFYLFYLDSQNAVQNDTYHVTIDDAMMQASLEFRVSPEEWEDVEENNLGGANGVPPPTRYLQTQSVSLAQISSNDSRPRVDVYLTVAGSKTLNVMQVLLESIPGLSLLGAKTIVEHAPCKICSDAPADLASQVTARLESFGASVELMPSSGKRS